MIELTGKREQGTLLRTSICSPRRPHRSDALADGRHEVEEQVSDEVIGGLRASVHRAHNVPHLLLEVPLEREGVQVGKRLLRDLDVRLLLHPDKQRHRQTQTQERERERDSGVF